MAANLTNPAPSSALSLPPVRFSSALIAAVQQEKNAYNAVALPYFPRAIINEAQAVTDAMETRYLSAPTPDELRNFVSDLYDALNASVRNPTDERTLSVRAGIACTVLADAPRVVLGAEFERFCFARCKFLPSPADLLELAKEYAQPWREKTAQVRLIVTNDACKRFTQGLPPAETTVPEQSASRAEAQRVRKNMIMAFPSQRESRHA